ncbi:MAG: hypothetical protein U0790_02215 [Isosphaeraceae bacterium]
MARQTLMWTTLPNGLTEDRRSLRVSVFLSPRLHAEGDPPELASFFPDWEDWPATLRRATFKVSYGGSSVAVPATQRVGPSFVDTSVGEADSTVWKSLFHRGLLVRGYEFKDFSGTPVVSYDTVAVAGRVQDLYSKLARAANGYLPRVSDIVDDPDWRELIEAVATLDDMTTYPDTGLRNPKSLAERAREDRFGKFQELVRLQRFHMPPQKPRPVVWRRRDDDRIEASWMEHERTALPHKTELAKQLDFHQIVAAMSSYPTLLRRLGIVVDLVLDLSQFTQASDAPLATTVKFPDEILPVAATKHVSPVTHAGLSITAFGAVSHPTGAVSPPALKPNEFRVVDRLLDLDPSRFALLQADVDGAGLKLMGFARSLRRLVPEEDRVDPTTRFEKELGVPSLRTTGLMLVHRGRGAMLEDRFATNWEKNYLAEQGAQPELWAEDLVRGLRFDVWDQTTRRWRSLCRREATYEVGGVPPFTVEEEGTVRLGATGWPGPRDKPDVIYLHEAVVSWTGWSLAAPPPGRAIWRDDPDATEENQTVPGAEPELLPGIAFQSRFGASPGSLPRLRFGRSYRLRARVVDLAGNSLPPKEEDFGPEQLAQNAQPFLRYEPVAAPVIALVKRQDGTIERPAEGESMHRVAIRSLNNTSADNAVPTTQVARRFAVPPQVSVKDAEHHGMLDVGGRVDPATFDLLANRKDRDSSDPNAALIVERLSMQGPTDQAPVETAFAVYRDGHALTYLPDPLAEVVAARIFGHPGIADTTIISIPLYPNPIGAWPEIQPFKIEVFEDPSVTPHFDETSRVLRVPLAKADRASVRLSMQLSPEATREKMGIWQWLTKQEQQALEPLARDGQHWMLTPWRTVEVVHAVQRPLIAPVMDKMVVSRSKNKPTSATPQFIATCSIKSTDRVDLLAEWHEPSDDPSAPKSLLAAVDRSHGDVAFTIKITDAASYAQKRDGHKGGGIAEHTIEGPDLIGVNIPRDLMLEKRHEFGDTRYRRVEYWLEATTKFREYMPSALLTQVGADGEQQPTDEHIKVIGPRTVTWIPNSAPPPAPEVLYVVPTFGWVRSTDAQGNASSWRRGGGLRVYLNRPWNDSGYGEMLAVVLPPPTFAGDPETKPDGRPYKKYATQWGNDPIWESPFVAGLAPTRSSFPLARTAPDPNGSWLPKCAPRTECDQKPEPFNVTKGLSPGGQYSGDFVEIAPHDVFYDEERRLWYCDIEVDQGASYWPFIRLALARYHPTSVSGAHLSDVVLADLMPLTADRWINVNQADNPRTRQVTVFGHSYSDSSGHFEAIHSASTYDFDITTGTRRVRTPADVAQTNVIEVWVEQFDPARGEDFGWARVLNASVERTGPHLHLMERTTEVGPEGSAASWFVPGNQLARALELHRCRRFGDLVAEGLVDKIFTFPPLWRGTVTLPVEPSSNVRFRLVIAEFEEYIVDDDRPYDVVPTKKDRRLVFVEHIELT